MRMFTRQADGVWRVQLGAQAVAVTPPTDAELALTAGNEQSATAIDALARGGSAGTMLAFITGHEMVRFSFKFAKDAAAAAAERTERLRN